MMVAQARSKNRRERPTRLEMRRAMWSQAEHIPIGHAAWCEQVKHKLLDGYGVEDIAIWLDCHVSHVRTEVQRLRASGDLQKWWGQECA